MRTGPFCNPRCALLPRYFTGFFVFHAYALPMRTPHYYVIYPRTTPCYAATTVAPVLYVDLSTLLLSIMHGFTLTVLSAFSHTYTHAFCSNCCAAPRFRFLCPRHFLLRLLSPCWICSSFLHSIARCTTPLLRLPRQLLHTVLITTALPLPANALTALAAFLYLTILT